MTKKMLIDAAHPEEIRVAVLDQNRVEDFDFESAARKPLRGNIYLARVTRVEPSLQAAFVEYGGNRHGFLAFSEIHPDYYQIPVADRERLQAAEAEVADLAAKLELSQRGDEDDEDDAADREEANADDAPGMSDDDGENDAPEDSVASPEPDSADAAAAESDGEPSAHDADDAPEALDDEEKEEEEEEEDAEKKDGADEDGSADKKPSAAAAFDQPDIQTADLPVAEEDASESDIEARAETADDNASPEDEDAAPEAGADIEDDARAEPQDEDGDDDHGDDDAVDAAANDDASDDDAADDDDEDDSDEDENPEQTRSARNALFERYKEAKRKRSQLLRNYKIQEVIKRRQILLIQVVKEERGNKGAALTTYLSLAGRYCVLMPNTARGGGISRKIPNGSDRRRLRRVVDSLEVPQGMGLIIRTAGAKRTKTEIKRDYEYLLRLWENIRTLTLKSIAPCLIYEEASLIKRAIRDLYDKDIGKVMVEGEAGYREAKDFMKMLMPSHAKHVQPHKERAPIFLKHGVEAQLDGMYQPSVRLKSGGYIVIHQTEALVAIDVNSGRATRERNIELTALKTNIEAAQEAARQFRLRDLAGLIVIDFIDMEEQKNNRKVEKALKDALKADRARIQTGRISAFGLLEMSRQRRRSGIVDGTTQVCPTCAGAGVIRSMEMAALRILRAIEGEAISGKVGRIAARASIDASLYLLNHHRDWLKRIETDNGVSIEIVADSEKSGDAYDLEKSGAPRPVANEAQVVRADQTETIEADDDVATAEEDGAEAQAEARADDRDEEKEGGRKRRRRRRRKKDAAATTESGAAETADAEDAAEKPNDRDEDAQADAAADGDEEKPKRRRRRGRRGGRRNRQSADGTAENGSAEGAAAGQEPESDETAPQEADIPANEGGEDGAAVSNASPQDDMASPEAVAEADDTPPHVEPAKPETADSEAHVNGAASESSDAPAAATDAVSEEEETAPEAAPQPEPQQEAKPKKPARKGWWNRASSA